MSIEALLANIQTPEQIKALSVKMAKAGRPPQGMPGMAAGSTPAPAAPAGISMPQAAANPAAVPPDLGSILGGFGNA